MASPPAPVTFDPKTRSTRLCGSSRRGFPPCDGAGSLPTELILDPGMGFFLSPAPETSLHVLSNLQKLKSALGLPLLVSVSRKSFLGATVGLPVKDLGPASLAAELHAIGNGADYVRTHAPGDLRSAITFSETLAKFRSRDARDRGLDHA
ncbi:dihydropteroate synthase [Vibrio cholerae]|uniref:dihydropteroate synthase n=1 Tax=Vibrio cholerae TaxID=666 RepID=UPI003C6F2575